MNVYHYTSLDAVKGILRNKDICLWGTRYDSLNDPTDCIYAEEDILPEFKEFLKEKSVNENELEDIKIYPYVVSFSRIEDDFNMWRMYKAEIAIEFDAEVIKNMVDAKQEKNSIASQDELFWGECKYPKGKKEKHQAFAELYNTTPSTDKPVIEAREILPLIKRPEFANENEYRLYAFDCNLAVGDGENARECEVPHNIHTKCIQNKDFILYKEFHLPVNSLKGFIINVRDDAYFEKVKSHLELILLSSNIMKKMNIRKTRNGQNINLNI